MLAHTHTHTRYTYAHTEYIYVRELNTNDDVQEIERNPPQHPAESSHHDDDAVGERACQVVTYISYLYAPNSCVII